MSQISIQIIDKVGLNEREKALIQTTTMNFAAMTSALIVGEDMVINPHDTDAIGVTLVYSNPLDEEIAVKMKQSLENRFTNFFKMAEIDLKADVDLV